MGCKFETCAREPFLGPAAGGSGAELAVIREGAQGTGLGDTSVALRGHLFCRCSESELAEVTRVGAVCQRTEEPGQVVVCALEEASTGAPARYP